MIPAYFPEQTSVLAKDQPQYIPLPVHRADDPHGTVTSCWHLTWTERFRLLWTGTLWIQNLTFHDRLQPIRPTTEKPDLKPMT